MAHCGHPRIQESCGAPLSVTLLLAGLHVRLQHAMLGRQRAVHQQMHPAGSVLVPGLVPKRPAVCADNQPGDLSEGP